MWSNVRHASNFNDSWQCRRESEQMSTSRLFKFTNRAPDSKVVHQSAQKRKPTVPFDASLTSTCHPPTSWHNHSYKENLRERKPTKVYGHKDYYVGRALSLSTYRYDDDVVQRFRLSRPCGATP